MKMFLAGGNFDISNTILPLRVRLIPFPNVTLLLLIRFQQQVFSKFHEISNPSHPSCLQMIETNFYNIEKGIMEAIVVEMIFNHKDDVHIEPKCLQH